MGKRVKLIGYYGDDLTIACAAWTSTGRDITTDKLDRVPQMIKYLFDNKHMTCFERGIIHLLVETDITSHIHIIKHRTIGTNGESARYKELKEDKFYIPEDFKEVPLSWDTNTFIGYETLSNWAEVLEDFTNQGNALYHQCLSDLTPVLGRKRAKESARYFKGYNSVITTDVIMNMSSFANFYKLRHSDKAQKEISDIAFEIMQVCKSIESNPFATTLELIENQ